MLAHVQLLVHRQDGVRKRQLKFFNFSVLACTKYCQAWVRVKPLQQQLLFKMSIKKGVSWVEKSQNNRILCSKTTYKLALGGQDALLFPQSTL